MCPWAVDTNIEVPPPDLPLCAQSAEITHFYLLGSHVTLCIHHGNRFARMNACCHVPVVPLECPNTEYDFGVTGLAAGSSR